ncbi:MAG: hypothetical protein AAGI30_08330 [Planctomycetota bacterium]
MKYIKVVWKHECPDDPIWLYSEIDDKLWEVRKVEKFGDGRCGYASKQVDLASPRLGSSHSRQRNWKVPRHILSLNSR